MKASSVRRIAPAASSSALTALVVDERDCDMQGVAMPRPEVNLVVRFGPSARRGLDVHALGGRQRVLRKTLRSGQRTVMARLHLGATEAVLGVPASAIAGRVVTLEDLWGDLRARSLFDRLAAARDTFEAARVLESAIAERFATAAAECARTRFVLDAADRLTSAKRERGRCRPGGE